MFRTPGISLKWKIIFVVIPSVVVSLTISLSNIKGLGSLNDQFTNFYEVTLPRAQTLSDIQITLSEIGLLQKKAILNPSGPESTEIGVRMERAKDTMSDLLKNWEKVVLAANRPNLEKIRALLGDYYALHDEMTQLIHQKELPAANKLSETQISAKRKAIIEILSAARKVAQQSIKNQIDATAQEYLKTKIQTFVMNFVGLMVAIGLAYTLSKKIASKINDIIEKIAHNSQVLDKLSKMLVQNSQKLSEAATEQAAELQETASATEEIGTTIARNSENAMTASTLGEKSEHAASEGKQTIGEMIDALENIKGSTHSIIQQSNDSNTQMDAIFNIIKDISVKTKVIHDIVFQTRLLSFNASVEAARAGEFGKGFAVVAEEVGNLAIMSGNAAKEISTKLDSGLIQIQEIIAKNRDQLFTICEEAKAKVSHGLEVGMRCNGNLNLISEQVQSASSMVKGIATAGAEQTKATDEIKRAIAELNTVTHVNAQSAENCTQCAKELNSESENLKILILQLSCLVDGNRAPNIQV